MAEQRERIQKAERNLGSALATMYSEAKSHQPIDSHVQSLIKAHRLHVEDAECQLFVGEDGPESWSVTCYAIGGYYVTLQGLCPKTGTGE